jgi:hypothetical protein
MQFNNISTLLLLAATAMLSVHSSPLPAPPPQSLSSLTEHAADQSLGLLQTRKPEPAPSVATTKALKKYRKNRKQEVT